MNGDKPWKNARVRIKCGWSGAGNSGTAVGEPVFIEQWWLPILWDGEEDPDFHKLAGIELKPKDDLLKLELHEDQGYVYIYVDRVQGVLDCLERGEDFDCNDAAKIWLKRALNIVKDSNASKIA